MAYYNFEKDLIDGQKAELEAIEKLKARFKIGDENIERSDQKGWDIRIKTNGKTFEVKNDLMAHKTGNIAIEFECRGKATALAVTNAEYWIYKFSGTFWVIPTALLRQKLFVEKLFFREVTGGDAGSNTKMYLIKVDAFKSWAREL